MRTGLRRWRAANNSEKWVEALPKLMDAYNDTVTRVHKMKPIEVFTNPDVAWEAYGNRYFNKKKEKEKKLKKEPKLLKIGSYCRISRIKGAFEKQSTEKGVFSREIYKIVDIKKHMKRPMYILEDLRGKRIIGGFYPEEVLEINYSPDELYEIEKVFENTRRIDSNGIPVVKVKWKNYHARDSTFIPESDIIDLFPDLDISKVH